MSNWSNIDNNSNKFRLHCNSNNCSLSLANVIKGHLAVTALHGTERHSYHFNNEDMLFVVSQYLLSLSPSDRTKILQFFHGF